ncbi:hypothetical protein EJ02DRAFT_452131 [Clathrospora elynae]|uniref:Uncharacterized protein n=1 Tax=Clathrospora elynae TaxID=706981 RepID=A0A6A5T244_9PLEO|nr:hypothetical protein EJ02DRAFT_452131 [Clathrospora elynae]
MPESDMRGKPSSTGRKYHSADCNVNISMQGALEFFVTVKGKRYGSVTARYD